MRIKLLLNLAAHCRGGPGCGAPAPVSVTQMRALRPHAPRAFSAASRSATGSAGWAAEPRLAYAWIDHTSLRQTTSAGSAATNRATLVRSRASVCNAFSSSRDTTPSWNSAGVAGRYTSSFFAAVAGFMVWALRAVMAAA